MDDDDVEFRYKRKEYRKEIKEKLTQLFPEKIPILFYPGIGTNLKIPNNEK